jgi:CBS domain containing-hemolysin-like protein
MPNSFEFIPRPGYYDDMTRLIISLLLVALACLAIVLDKTYYKVGSKELKRLAKTGDRSAKELYRAVAYGSALQFLLWLIVVVSGTVSVVLFAEIVSGWLAAIIGVVILWLIFLWLPQTRPSALGERITLLLTPALAWLLHYLHPVLAPVARIIYSSRSSSTGIYSKEDLLELLDWQKDQPGNTIPVGELDIMKSSLMFEDKSVSDILIPRRSVDLVDINDTIGPVLLEELHRTGHHRFPVYSGKKDNIVGTLLVRDVLKLAEQGGEIKDIFKHDVQYVHEDFSLIQVWQAFIKTKHHLFIVVNSFEEFVGIVTIEDVVAQVIGRPLIDEFDKHNDRRAVAALKAKTEHQEHLDEETELEEVVK